MTSLTMLSAQCSVPAVCARALISGHGLTESAQWPCSADRAVGSVTSRVGVLSRIVPFQARYSTDSADLTRALRLLD